MPIMCDSAAVGDNVSNTDNPLILGDAVGHPFRGNQWTMHTTSEMAQDAKKMSSLDFMRKFNGENLAEQTASTQFKPFTVYHGYVNPHKTDPSEYDDWKQVTTETPAGRDKVMGMVAAAKKDELPPVLVEGGLNKDRPQVLDGHNRTAAHIEAKTDLPVTYSAQTIAQLWLRANGKTASAAEINKIVANYAKVVPYGAATGKAAAKTGTVSEPVALKPAKTASKVGASSVAVVKSSLALDPKHLSDNDRGELSDINHFLSEAVKLKAQKKYDLAAASMDVVADCHASLSESFRVKEDQLRKDKEFDLANKMGVLSSQHDSAMVKAGNLVTAWNKKVETAPKRQRAATWSNAPIDRTKTPSVRFDDARDNAAHPSVYRKPDGISDARWGAILKQLKNKGGKRDKTFAEQSVYEQYEDRNLDPDRTPPHFPAHVLSQDAPIGLAGDSFNDADGKWVTMHGTPVFIKDGESVGAAMHDAFPKSTPS